jgi:hypothetical protein
MRAYVEHEDDLISSRLTWSLTVHGFLFAVYGLLLGKAADMFVELHKLPASPKLLEHVISGLFFFQLPIALIGAIVGRYSREAIVGAHNAIAHVCAIAHASGALRIPPDTSVRAAIAQGRQTVTPNSMLGIVVNAQLLVHNGKSEETVTVSAVDANTFTATFDRDHAAEASLTPVSPNTSVPDAITPGRQTVTPNSMFGIVVNAQLLVDNGQASEETVSVNAVYGNAFTAIFVRDHAPGASLTLVGPILLPRIIDGGAPPSHTGRTRSLYLGLPGIMMVVWIVLGIVSVGLGILSLVWRCWFS